MDAANLKDALKKELGISTDEDLKKAIMEEKGVDLGIFVLDIGGAQDAKSA